MRSTLETGLGSLKLLSERRAGGDPRRTAGKAKSPKPDQRNKARSPRGNRRKTDAGRPEYRKGSEGDALLQGDEVIAA